MCVAVIGGHPAQDVLNATATCDIGVYGIAEPNTAMNDSIKTAINTRIKSRFGSGFITAESGPGRKTGYNPGGIMQVIQGKVAGRHSQSGAEKWGRFLWLTL